MGFNQIIEQYNFVLSTLLNVSQRFSSQIWKAERKYLLQQRKE